MSNIMFYAAVSVCCLLSLYSLTSCSNLSQKKGSCPLWHIMNNYGKCECGETYSRRIICEKNFVHIIQGNCLTWNNSTSRAELHPCLFSSLWDFKHICEYNVTLYWISMDISGEALNNITCGGYNRKGPQCRQCFDQYGPAVFSDGVTCADCSKHKHVWSLNLLLQLCMVTFIYLIFIPLQISAAASPHNIIMIYAQLIATALKFNGHLYINLICRFGKTFASILITILDIWNLDFFRLIIPPLCISASFKVINTLLFDYIIAIYPLIFSAFIYLCIELHDRNNRLVVFLSFPVRKCFNSTWNPKKTILNTFTTFCLLSYSKFLFVSINFLSAVQIYNSHGKTDSKVLLYDPMIRFLHSEHIPYVILALSILVVFNCVPPLFLLLYSIKVFRKCLQLLKIRWDIVNNIMDIFQGWYKDGMEGTRDYRYISGLYFLLRIILSCEIMTMISMDYGNEMLLWKKTIPGIIHFLLGAFFLVAKPYKRMYMNHADGLIFTLIGGLLFVSAYDIEPLYILGTAAGSILAIFILLYSTYYMCIKQQRNSNL